MNNIFPFVPRSVAGDWTAGERARLLELADHLSANGVPVEVAFGQTDAGDPWCVVTDEQQEVLVHLARIDGRFVIHDAAFDIIRQVNSLWGAVRQVLGATGVEARGEVVVALNPPGREAQTFLALVIAVGFYLENHVGDGSDPRWDFEVALRDARPQTHLPPSAMIAALNAAADKLIGHPLVSGDVEAAADAAPTAKAVSVDVAAPAASAEPTAGVAAHKAGSWSPPAPADPAHAAVATLAAPAAGIEGFAAARLVLTGGPAPDVLIGGPGGDVIHGGGDDDYIDGAGARAGETDQLFGDAGDDTIVLGARVVAMGGAGADTFVVSTTPTAKATTTPIAAAEHHPSLLGLVVDFSTAQGDRVVFTTQTHVTVVGSVAVADVWTQRGDQAGAATTTALAGARVGFDFDGDGVEDAFLLLGGADAKAWQAGDPGDIPVRPTELSHSGSAPVEPTLIGHGSSSGSADADLR